MIDGHLFYFKAKSATDDRQTLYVLQVPKRHRYQMNMATLHRAAEFTNPCVQVLISGVEISSFNDKLGDAMKGRPMQFYTASPRPIREDPDS